MVGNDKMSISHIKALRSAGSVEPKKPVSSMIKLDLSNGRLDSYEPNQISASEILAILQKKFSLTEGEITIVPYNFSNKVA